MAGATLQGMVTILEAVVGALLVALGPRAILVAENLVLRQQLAILRRATPASLPLCPSTEHSESLFPLVVAVGGLSGDRPTGDRDRLASARLCSVVGVEVVADRSSAAWSRTGRHGK
jgi:hypothetical protein